ncbi:MAG TPA: hypothetical protein VNO55_13370 [Polyangia bacterium]|nr:hypothetical protein [Polyangia bacterium]
MLPPFDADSLSAKLRCGQKFYSCVGSAPAFTAARIDPGDDAVTLEVGSEGQ